MKILFVAPFQMPLRNFLHSGLAMACVARGLEVEFASPYEVEAFTDHLGNVYRNYPVASAMERGGLQSPFHTSRVLKVLCSLRMNVFAIEHPDGSYLMHTLARRPRTLSDWISMAGIKWAFSRGALVLFPTVSRRRRMARQALLRWLPHHRIEAGIIRQARPDVVVVSTHGVYWLDIRFLIEARRASVKTLGFVLSWDNLYSRGPMMQRPDQLLVWSETMKRQAIDVHQYPADRISVVGALQFFVYAEPPDAAQVNQVRAQIGLAVEEEYLFYVAGAWTPDYDFEDLTALQAALSRSEFRNLRLVVRPHPQSPAESRQRLSELNVIVDDVPDLNSAGTDPLCLDRDHVSHMAALLVGAKAVVSSWGTTALLEAAALDRPILQLRWMDALNRRHPEQTDRVRMFQRYLHLREFDDSGCRKFCDRPEQLADDLRDLLTRDSHFRQGRWVAVAALVAQPIAETIQRASAAIAAAVWLNPKAEAGNTPPGSAP